MYLIAEGGMHRSINVIAALGLALGGALGLAGAMVTQQNVQAMLWAIDGAGLVMAAAMLATKYFRAGNDVVAGGFLVFAIGEGVILLSAPAAGLAGSIPAFAAGTALCGDGASPCQRSKVIRHAAAGADVAKAIQVVARFDTGRKFDPVIGR